MQQQRPYNAYTPSTPIMNRDVILCVHQFPDEGRPEGEAVGNGGSLGLEAMSWVSMTCVITVELLLPYGMWCHEILTHSVSS